MAKLIKYATFYCILQSSGAYVPQGKNKGKKIKLCLTNTQKNLYNNNNNCPNYKNNFSNYCWFFFQFLCPILLLQEIQAVRGYLGQSSRLRKRVRKLKSLLTFRTHQEKMQCLNPEKPTRCHFLDESVIAQDQALWFCRVHC